MAHVLKYIGTWYIYYAGPFDWKITTADLEKLQN